MKKSRKTLFDIIIFVVGLLGLYIFTPLHDFISQMDSTIFALTCAIILGVSLIHLKNSKDV